MKFRTARKTSSASCCTFTAAPDKTDLASSSSTPPPSSSSPSISSPSPHRNHSHLHHHHDFLLHLRRHHHLTKSSIILIIRVISLIYSESIVCGGPSHRMCCRSRQRRKSLWGARQDGSLMAPRTPFRWTGTLFRASSRTDDESHLGVWDIPVIF